jgi:hypothetical protein
MAPESLKSVRKFKTPFMTAARSAARKALFSAPACSGIGKVMDMTPLSFSSTQLRDAGQKSNDVDVKEALLAFINDMVRNQNGQSND